MRWRKTKSFGQQLSDPRYYRRAIEHLHRKRASQLYGLYVMQPGGYTLSQAYLERRRLSRILARAVSGGEYQFSPTKMNTVIVEGKARQLCGFTLMDRIVHGAAYLMLVESLQSGIAPSVYSYISGRSKYQAIDGIAEYVRVHRAARPDPRDRGLYTIRCDIKSYCKSIPVGQTSPLWNQMHQWIETSYGRPMSAFETSILEQLTRPVLVTEEGTLYQTLYGAPLGAPISVLIMNMYVASLDEIAGRYAGGFYARYNDDLIFLHPDPETFSVAEKEISTCLTSLGLRWNEAKTRRLFFNAAGRPAGALKGTPRIEFLGYSIGFDSALTLRTESLRAFLREMRVRVRATHQVLKDLPFEERGRGICRMINDALDPKSAHGQHYAGVLLQQTNDNRQLRQLDYLLARMVLRVMTGQSGVRAFRQLPYRKIRDEWRLHSLEYARNR